MFKVNNKNQYLLTGKMPILIRSQTFMQSFLKERKISTKSSFFFCLFVMFQKIYEDLFETLKTFFEA